MGLLGCRQLMSLLRKCNNHSLQATGIHLPQDCCPPRVGVLSVHGLVASVLCITGSYVVQQYVCLLLPNSHLLACPVLALQSLLDKDLWMVSCLGMLWSLIAAAMLA